MQDTTLPVGCQSHQPESLAQSHIHLSVARHREERCLRRSDLPGAMVEIACIRLRGLRLDLFQVSPRVPNDGLAIVAGTGDVLVRGVLDVLPAVSIKDRDRVWASEGDPITAG